MMIGTVMFLGGFFTALLAFYGRNAPLLMLAVVLFSFCWVGREWVHKAVRIIPIGLLAMLSIVEVKQSCQSLYSRNDILLAVICVLMIVLLLTSMLPSSKVAENEFVV